MKLLRSIVAIVAGWIVWAAVFWLIMIVEALLWPAMDEAARAYFATGSYASFDTAMLASFQVVWLVVNAAAGLVTGFIAKRGAEVAIFAILLAAYFAYNHLWALWDDFPAWYNVLVVLLVVPMVLVGGTLARRMRSRRIAAAAAG